VLQRLPANGGRRIAQRTEFVFLILKQVGIDRPRANAKLLLQSLHSGHVLQAVGQIPKHMQRQRGRCPCQAVDLGRVGKFLFDGACRRRACTNLPKRVPVLANPQDGISMRKPSSALKAISCCPIPMASSLPLTREMSVPR
jgi:hypothetical protein